MRKTATLLIALVVSFLILNQAPADAGNTLALYIGSPIASLNGQEVDIDPNPEVTPYIKNDRTMVPLRFITESFNCSVSWDQEQQTATVIHGTTRLLFTIGSDILLKNSQEISLDPTPEIVNDRIFLPIYAVVSALDKNVGYDSGLVLIGDNDVPITEELFMSYADRLNSLPVVGNSETLETLISPNNYRYSGKGIPSNGSTSVAGLAGAPAPEVDFAAPPVVTDTKTSKSFEESTSGGGGSSGAAGAPMATGAPPPMPEPQVSLNEATDSDEYSKTNTQVEGVDESDIIKTDGKYIYFVNNERVLITGTAGNMRIMSKIDFTLDQFTPTDLYLDDDMLIVLGAQIPQIQPYSYDSGNTLPSPANMPIRAQYTNQLTTAYILTLDDQKQEISRRIVSLEGDLITSRKIGDNFYFITNMYAYYQNGGWMPPYYVEDYVPHQTGFETMRYFPGHYANTYMCIGSVNVRDNSTPMNVSSFLGGGNEVYVSQKNMYVTTTDYSNQVQTQIYKFSLQDSKVTFLHKGRVDGTIINQFSMDEHNNNFRIATNDGDSNSLYVLGETLEERGRIEDIAPGELIYSVRFMGDRGYMVTFKTTDPLFAMDLKDPQNPKILGQLKIPGFSQYLHPYDENHLIGFGKDTIEIKRNNSSDPVAYELGFKISVFDVTDMENPVEKYVEIIGDRGTYSELSHNHRALLFDKDKELVAFPIALHTVTGEKIRDYYPVYGDFVDAGAICYRFNLEQGFTEQTFISHADVEEKLKQGSSYNPHSDNEIKRLIFIGDILYSISTDKMQAHTIDGFNFIEQLKLTD